MRERSDEHNVRGASEARGDLKGPRPEPTSFFSQPKKGPKGPSQAKAQRAIFRSKAPHITWSKAPHRAQRAHIERSSSCKKYPAVADIYAKQG
jgi:hypothetical protein